MWSWMSENAQVLDVWVGVGTLLVWLFYAHLLFAGFRRIRQAQVLITQGWGNSIDSICMVNNMSQEAIYLEDIILSLSCDEYTYSVSVADFEDADPYTAPGSGQYITRQGPLHSAQSVNIGTFRSLIRQAARASGWSEDQERPIKTLNISSLTITVVSIYGPKGTVVAAQRKFKIIGDDNEHLQAQRVNTRQLRGAAARRRIRRWVRRRL